MINLLLAFSAIILYLLPVIYIGQSLMHELHMMQLNSYRNKRYIAYLKKNLFRKTLWLSVAPIIGIILLAFGYYKSGLITNIFLWLSLMMIYKRPPEKKPLVMTARAKRLYVASLGLVVLISVSLAVVMFAHDNYLCLIVNQIIALICAVFPCIVMVSANTLLQPLENYINKRFLRDAQRIIQAKPSLTVLGVTGSFGKTSTKVILGEILKEKYMTLITPDSYNTPMGITRVIREQLKNIDEFFVAEMGAKQVGDIAELCDLVHPKSGILTAIGEQHLETFGSLEKIIATKYELIHALPSDGFAVLNMDNEYIRNNAKDIKAQVVTYGLDSSWDYYADQIDFTSLGCSFLIHTVTGEEYPFQTMLLGKHNVSNIVGAVALAHQYGVSLEKAALAVKRLKPIPHRLSLATSVQGINIIDDAFNSNPVGAYRAIEVLACFTEGKRILITPGMVELGERQDEINKAWIQEAAKSCDYIMLVGKRHTQSMQDGLKEIDYPAEQWVVTKDLNEASQLMHCMVNMGDTVLFENDLPDDYNE